MNKSLVRRAASPFVLSTLLLAPAIAQADEEVVDDIETGAPAERPGELEMLPTGTLAGELPPPVVATEGRNVKFEWSVRASAAVHSANNADLRPYDASSDETVRDTDDRHVFGYSDVAVGLHIEPARSIWLDTQVEVATQWPTFVLTGTPSAALAVYELALGFDVVDIDAFRLSATLGRQPWQIGGVPVDYMFASTTDSATASLDFRKFGRVRVLGFDLVSGQELPEGGYQRYPEGSEPAFGFDGESFTWRTGGLYEIDQDALPFGLTAAAYYFYSQIGGSSYPGSGADISYGGQLGNFADRDYQHLYGARAAYTHQLDGDGDESTDDGGSFTVFAEFARSGGIDRKELVADHDVETAGNALGGGATFEMPIGIASIEAGAAFYRFDGADYDSNGMQFGGGFVGFRGARVGGLALGRSSAWRPSAVLAPDGVEFTPHRRARASGTQFLHGYLGFGVLDTSLRFDVWALQDTSSTFVDFARFDEVRDPPYGYSRQEILAQERLGQSLGLELDVQIAQRVADMLELYAGFGMFMPGSYYEVEVDRIVDGDDTALGGTANYTVLRVGAELSF